MQDIGGQLYSRILMIFAKVVTCVKNWKTSNKKSDKFGNNTSKTTFYEMRSKFNRSSQTNKKTNMKQIYFGSYILCNQIGKSKGTQNQ